MCVCWHHGMRVRAIILRRAPIYKVLASPGMAELPPSEVKGVWFVAARDYARELHGEDLVTRMVAASPEPYRDIYASPIASAWYPEAAFEQGLIVIYDVMTEGNDMMFERIMEGCTEHGINRVFRMLLRASSPSFVLRRVPTMWRQLRRGAGHVDVQQVEGESFIRYSELPWFHNPLYRMLTVGSLRALVRVCTGEAPRIEVLEHTRSTMSLHIRYKADSITPSVNFTSTRPPSESIPLAAFTKPEGTAVHNKAAANAQTGRHKIGEVVRPTRKSG